MRQQEVEGRIELALEAALRSAEDGFSSRTLAGRVYDCEPELMTAIRRPWIVDRLTRMLDRRINLQGSEKQGKLPGLEGLPLKIPARDEGEKVKVQLRNATLPQLLEYRKNLVKELRTRKDRKLEELDRLIAFMKEHAGRNHRKTVADVLKQHKFEFAMEA
jgi:hypothetical protein